MVQHKKERGEELVANCDYLIMEQDATKQEVEKIKSESGGWEDLRNDLAKEIDRRFVVKSLADKMRE